MSFFFNEAKAAPKKTGVKKSVRRADIPIASLRDLGCSVCPRDRDEENLKSPKLEPSGHQSPLIYLLGGSPSPEDDRHNDHWRDKAGAAVYDKFGSKYMRANVRSNYITQCMGERGVVETECCRNRVIADIEASKPVVIVGVGDDVLSWATGMKGGQAMSHRGSLFPVKIGKHVCWFYCILFPAFALKKRNFGKSEYELTLEHDVAKIKDLVDAGLPEPVVVTGGYDEGIEIITGNEPGDLERLRKALQELAMDPKSGLDIETNGFRPYMLKTPMILTAAVGTFKRTVAFPVDHPEGWGTDGRRKAVRGLLMTYLLDSGRKAIHNTAFEMEWFVFFFGAGLLRRTEWDDTMAMAHSLDERGGTKSLDMQTLLNFGFNIKSLSNIDTSRLLEYPMERVLRYNAIDTKWTDRLRDDLLVKLRNQASDLYEYERKLRLAPTLVLTEAIGLDLDDAYAKDLKAKFTKQLEAIAAKIRRCPEIKAYEKRYGTFDPGNDDQVLVLMKTVLKREEVQVEDQRTQTVRWTTDEEALSKIPASEVPSAPLILEHRGSAKVLGTYIEPAIAKKWVCRDGKVRTKYNAMKAVTGRLASEDPNVQNFPARKNREVRGMIYAPDGQIMVACDYGQIEFRVVGMASEDPVLVKYCWTGYDVHMFWAERVVAMYPGIIDWIVSEFGIDWDEKGIKTLRQEMKNKWVFPQLFGSSVRSCAEALHLPDYVTEDLQGEFWDDFRVTKKWQEKLLLNYERNLYVETLGGRKRRGPMTKNEIINMPIQGTACDIVTAGMNAISELADASEDDEIQPRFNGHDDLTFVMATESADDKVPVIAREMCMPRFDYINVPLLVEVKTGKRWHDMKEIKVYKSHEIFKTPNPYV